MGVFYSRIKPSYTGVLAAYKRELADAEKAKTAPPPSGLFYSIVSIFKKPDPLLHEQNKLAAEKRANKISDHIKWLEKVFPILESIKNKPAEERGFADNIEALETFAEFSNYVTQNLEDNLKEILNESASWLVGNEVAGTALGLGKKCKLEKDFPAGAKLLEDKTQLYANLKDKGILPCSITVKGELIPALYPLMTRISASKNAVAKLANGETPGANLTNSGLMCFGSKFSWNNTPNALFLLRGFTAVSNYIEGQGNGGRITQDLQNGAIILRGSFVIHRDTGVSLSLKRPEPSPIAVSAATPVAAAPMEAPEAPKPADAEHSASAITEAPAAAEPVTTTDLTPAPDTPAPAIESKAPRLTAKL